MLLYHGTHTGALAGILEDGIAPRKKTQAGNWKRFPSKLGYVYLTTAYPLYFAVNAANGAETVDGKAPQPCIIEIDSERLDQEALCPDEDFVTSFIWHLISVGRTVNLPAVYRRCKSLEQVNRLVEPARFASHWKESAENLGNLAYIGTVPVSAITRYAQIDSSECRKLCRLAMEPSICVANYLIMGRYYRSMVSHIFDGTPLEDAGFSALSEEQIAHLNLEPGMAEARRKHYAGIEASSKTGITVNWNRKREQSK